MCIFLTLEGERQFGFTVFQIESSASVETEKLVQDGLAAVFGSEYCVLYSF